MNDFASSPFASAASASPTTEAFAVRIGHIWLMVLALTAGLVIGLLSVFAGASALGLLLALGLLATGYWAWRRGYQAVQLVLTPECLRVLPPAPGAPVEDIPLSRIANYLRPREAYYQILELQLHGGGRRRFGKRMRKPAAGLLTLDDWTEALVTRLEQARPVAAAPDAAAAPVASGLVAERPRIFARTTFGKILAGLAGVWLVLVGLAALGGAHLAAGIFLAPIMYLGYYFRARGVLKVTTYAYTGANARRDRELQNELDDTRERTFDELNRFS
ncbi:hypothetical protein GKZ68_03075 [Hymenobacter sp. BRD128]|uniref:hypothetical protein n=1 Tax=Hymenobacter sp. BRD128 TaxID=2675878 RepID=UPI00156473B8|nr:hypothetical protein [Hymenobacter sp. BRD128]QKG55712.1 hypothetical protein GKZ68_03075 [Hymenobacter sp. BRD128]